VAVFLLSINQPDSANWIVFRYGQYDFNQRGFGSDRDISFFKNRIVSDSKKNHYHLCMALVESIGLHLMALMHLLYFDEIQAIKTHA